MKLRSNYLAIALATFSISASAQSLQEALVDGKVSGEIRSTYVNGTYTDAAISGINNNSNAGGLGLQLNYSTGDYNGFKVNLGIQGAYDLGIHDESNPNPTKGEDEPRATVEGYNMHIANISYQSGNTSLKIGKQFIVSPLIMGSGSFPLRDSFNGLSIVNKDIEKTTLKFYAITDWYQRYHAEDGSSKIVEFKKPLYSLYVKNNSVENLTVDAQVLTTKNKGSNADSPVITTDGYTTYVTRADYKLSTSHPLSIGLLYAGATFDKAGSDDAKMYGIKVKSKVANVGIKLAYTKIADDASYPGALGHAPNFFLYNGHQLVSDDLFAGTEVTSLTLYPKFDIANFSSNISFASFAQSDKGITNSGKDIDGANEIQLDLRYKFTGAAKGLSTRFTTASINYDLPSGQDDNMILSRLYLNYKF